MAEQVKGSAVTNLWDWLVGSKNDSLNVSKNWDREVDRVKNEAEASAGALEAALAQQDAARQQLDASIALQAASKNLQDATDAARNANKSFDDFVKDAKDSMAIRDIKDKVRTGALTAEEGNRQIGKIKEGARFEDQKEQFREGVAGLFGADDAKARAYYQNQLAQEEKDWVKDETTGMWVKRDTASQMALERREYEGETKAAALAGADQADFKGTILAAAGNQDPRKYLEQFMGEAKAPNAEDIDRMAAIIEQGTQAGKSYEAIKADVNRALPVEAGRQYTLTPEIIDGFRTIMKDHAGAVGDIMRALPGSSRDKPMFTAIINGKEAFGFALESQFLRTLTDPTVSRNDRGIDTAGHRGGVATRQSA